MTHLVYLTVPFVVEDVPSDTKLSQWSKLAHDSFHVMVDPKEIGLIKPSDVEYTVPGPFGHVHQANGSACVDNSNSCYEHARDGLGADDN